MGSFLARRCQRLVAAIGFPGLIPPSHLQVQHCEVRLPQAVLRSESDARESSSKCRTIPVVHVVNGTQRIPVDRQEMGVSRVAPRREQLQRRVEAIAANQRREDVGG